MTAERTPFAVLMTALGESLGLPSPAAPNSGPNKPAPSNPVAQQQCTQKKRKRTVACGHCDACGRDDCGTCLNCLDKPKFGGQGIRKQSCLERKCRFPTSATITTLTVSTPDEPTYAEPRAPPKPANRDRQEWDEFWGAVDCCMRLQSSPNLGSTVVESFDHANKKTRSARCGGCQGCVRGDCGDCKNCLDKPKFGGRGIKKQACLSRVCCNPQEDGVESPDSSPNLGPSKPTKEGFYSADPSPYQPGCATPLTVDTSPPPLELPAPSPNCERSTRGFGSSGGKRVSFAEDQSGGCSPSGGILPEEAEAEATTGYSTDDEAEGGRRLWGAALERARYSPLLAPTRRDEAAQDAENRPAQRSNVHTVQEEGVAEALVLAACPSTAQVMPLMLLLSAGTAR